MKMYSLKNSILHYSYLINLTLYVALNPAFLKQKSKSKIKSKDKYFGMLDGKPTGYCMRAAFAVLFIFTILFPVRINAQVDSVNGIPIQFEIQRTLQAGESGVGLNGTFNNWGDFYNRHPYPLKNIGNNTWVVTVPLLPDTARNYTYKGPGFYEYKFVTYSVSGGDTSITAWIPDPQNPLTDPKDNNNSILYLTDPVVYRLLPVSGLVTKEKTPLISAKLATSPKSKLIAQSIKLYIDGAEVPNSPGYYDSTQQSLTYQIVNPLPLGEHTVKITVMNDKGFTGADSSSFTISNLITEAPYQFVFDPFSPSLKFLGDSITNVSIQGVFNNYGADPLTGPDSDGLFKIKEVLPLNVKTEYQYIVKGASASTAYLYDPDNPHLNPDFNPYVIKQINTVPQIEDASPHQGTILPYPSGIVNISAVISPNDTNTVIDTNTVKVYLDGSLISSYVDTTGGKFIVRAAVSNLQIGRHVVKFSASDINGNTAKDYYSTFGVYASNTGYHYVDGQYDDNGPGSYSYPAGTSPHSSDIQSIDINANPAGDSLLFTITMGAVDDYTRIGMEITSQITGDYVDAMQNAGIKLPDWNNYGVYFIVAAPNSAQLNGSENTIYVSRDPLQKGITLAVNTDAKTSGQFKFSIPLAYLENILGTYAGKWYFGAFSYFANSSGTIKVNGKLGGSDLNGNPNVYDLAFSGSNSIQHRLLSNYILPYFVGGPKPAIIGAENRSLAAVDIDQISPALANRPDVALLTGGGDWYEDTVRVYGKVSDLSVTTAKFYVKNGTASYDTTVSVNSGIFSAIVPLTDGLNAVSASVVKNSITTTSKVVYFNFHKDHSTNIVINYSISQNNVTLDASGSTNPDGLPVTYNWTVDPNNPAGVNLSGSNSSITSFALPAVNGEYYFTLTATTSLDTTWSRAVVVVDSGVAHTVDMKTWHPDWVDKAVIYEIYPRSFSFFGNLSSIIPALPRLKQLGITCIWLMPIMPAASPHGYNITDYYDINPDYGTKQDFTNLINAAHKSGIRIMMDLVINHTSAVHPFMVDAFKYKSYSPYYNFYQWDSKGNYQYLSNWWDLPNINYEQKWVRDYLIQMIKYWVEKFNIDGYRCDVAWGVNDTRPSGPAFWQRFRNTLKAIKPDMYLLGEAQSDQLRYFDDKFDSGYDWPFFNMLKGVMSHTSDISSLDSLVAWYESPSYPSYLRPFRFLENHDEVRFISVYSPEQTKLGAAILFTLPGVPLIYAGQEVGETTQRNMIGWNDVFNLQAYYQNIVRIRENNPALEQGSYIGLSNSSPDSVYSYLRISGNNRAIVINNFYGNSVNATVQIPLDTLHLDASKAWYANDVLNTTTQEISPASFTKLNVNVAPYQTQIIILGNSPLTGVKEETQQPLSYNLLQNYPNPFNPSTTITYEIARPEKIRLAVYDILGRQITTLVDQSQQPGIYKVVWDGKNNSGQSVSSGIYFYRLQTSDFTDVKKMILLK